MPHYGFNKIAGTTIVQEVGMSVYLFLKPDTPKRSSAPFIATRQPTYIVIIQTDSHNFGAHIMQQKIRIGVNCLTSQPWQTGTVQQHGAPRLGMQRGDMAKMALGFIEILFSPYHLRVIHITPCRNTKTLHIQVNIFHIFCRNIQLGIRKPHHAALIHLGLPLAYLFRIAAIGNTHIT